MLYSVRGTVLHGKHLGGKLGFPTLNLPLPAGERPADGVYTAVMTVLKNGMRYYGVLNQGLHPTFPDGSPSIEMHLPGVTVALYGEEIEIGYIRYLRPEKRFASGDELTEQIKRDVTELEKDRRCGEMKQAYLFVHFREKTTPDGEQVYFGLSRDGFHWESVNNGDPILWNYHGDMGARDYTIARLEDNSFVILGTDLSLSYGMRGKYHRSWREISRNGSKCLSMWKSEDLVNWTEQKLVRAATDRFGCAWAPDIIWVKEKNAWLVHWSGSVADNDYSSKTIYGTLTEDFETFSEPFRLLDEEADVIDSAMYEENGTYYLFLKMHPRIVLYTGKSALGPFTRCEAFDSYAESISTGKYEAPTGTYLSDGRFALFVDFFGVPGAGQGYVPLIADSLEKGNFVRSEADFEFPYGFKHGTILPITLEEYERIKNNDWSDKGWSNLLH